MATALLSGQLFGKVLTALGELARIPIPRCGKRTVHSMGRYIRDAEHTMKLLNALAGYQAEPGLTSPWTLPTSTLPSPAARPRNHSLTAPQSVANATDSPHPQPVSQSQAKWQITIPVIAAHSMLKAGTLRKLKAVTRTPRPAEEDEE